MSIRRGARPADHYATIANDFLRDPRLSLKARGLGGCLLSHAQGFESTAASIAKANDCGVDQVQSGLNELEKFGYLVREQNRDERGRVTSVDYVLTDQPGLSGTGKPRSSSDQAKQDVSAGQDSNGVFPYRVAPPLKKNKGLEDQLPEDQKSTASAAADAATPREPDQPPLIDTLPTSKTEGSTSGPPAVDRPDIDKLCTTLVDAMVGNGCVRPTITAKWRDAARLLLDKDRRELSKARDLIIWCQNHEFWRANIRSLPKFREQYDTLRLQANAEWERKRNGNGNRVPTTTARVAAIQALKRGTGAAS